VSIHVLSMVLKARLRSTNHKMVMIKLASCANDDGTRVFPAVATIAAEAQLSRRTVQAILRALEDEGLIVLEGHAAGGRGHAREYRIRLDALAERTAAPPEKGAASAPFEDGKGATVAPFEERKGANDDHKGRKSSAPHSSRTRQDSPPPYPPQGGNGSLLPDLARAAPCQPARQAGIDSAGSDSEFERWWAEGVPQHHRRDKGRARRAFRAARRKAPLQVLIAGYRRYHAELDRLDRPPDKRRYPATWLNGEGWLDAPLVPPDEASRAAWIGRVRGFRDSGRWFDEWGPPPGDPGCRAPPDLLAGAGVGPGRPAPAGDQAGVGVGLAGATKDGAGVGAGRPAPAGDQAGVGAGRPVPAGDQAGAGGDLA